MIVYIMFLTIIFSLMFMDNIILTSKRKKSTVLLSNSEESIYVSGRFSDRKKNKFSYTLKLALLVIFIFSAFRFDVGWDYLAYYATIKYSMITNIISNGEYVTIFLIDLSRNIGLTNFYFAVNTFICILFISKTIKNYSKDHWLSIVFFICFPLFFLNSLSVIRLFSALAITFYGFKYIEKRKFARYVLTVILAMMFHKSAFIAIIFYFCSNIKIKTHKLLITLILLPTASIVFNNLVIRYFPRYAGYTEATTGQEGTKAILIFVLIGIIAVLFREKITSRDKIANIYYNIYFMGLSVYLMFFSQGTMGHRLSLYGTIYSLLLLPKIISLFNNRKERVIINALVYVFCILAFLFTVSVGAETYIPYRTIWGMK